MTHEWFHQIELWEIYPPIIRQPYTVAYFHVLAEFRGLFFLFHFGLRLPHSLLFLRITFNPYVYTLC